MINQISLLGFKSFLNREVKLNQLTVLTGLNSSGKSSIIQALLMLEKGFNRESSILLDGHGSAEEIRNSYVNNEIELGVTTTDKEIFKVAIDTSDKSTPYKYECTENFKFPEILYVSAHRFGPKTSVTIYNDSYKRNRLGANGENLFQFIEAFADETIDSKLIHPNSEGETVLFNLRGWLSVISPNVDFKYKIDTISDTSYSTFNSHRATNVGFGLSYALSVIAALLIGTKIPNCLVIIENPEAHLHPKGQTEISRLISLCALVGTQVVIETHSDHVFDGIRIAAKEIKGFPNQVQLHWFELDKKLNTDIQSPTLTDDGKLDEWPEGLFDQFEINASKLI